MFIAVKLQKKKASVRCIVDDDDAHLAKTKWFLDAYGYAYTGGQRKKMHRLIMNAGKEMVVHHKNGNKLDNRKENLELLSNEKHSRQETTTMFNKRNLPTGVCFIRGLYQARIRYKGVRFDFGRFRTVEEAGEAYKKALSKLK